jgi:hypothetical protein
LKYSFHRAVIISLFSSTIDSASFSSAGFKPRLSSRETSGISGSRRVGFLKFQESLLLSIKLVSSS